MHVIFSFLFFSNVFIMLPRTAVSADRIAQDVSDGAVTLDGIDVRQFSQKELRSRIGYVPQKSILLSGPISFNLRYGKKDASDTEIREGAEIAQILDFIDQSPEGMEANLAQGAANVSGG